MDSSSTLVAHLFAVLKMEHTSIRLVVFDLDFTLWDAGGLWCDCTSPPYHVKQSGGVYDSLGREIRLYDDVLDTLEMLQSRGIQIALASRTDQPAWANELTKLLGIDSYVDYREIYPGSKKRHLSKISTDSGVPLSSMLFFDDEQRNINDAESIGVHAVFVTSGITYDTVLSNLFDLS